MGPAGDDEPHPRSPPPTRRDTHVSAQCRVVEIADYHDLAGIDALARHYTGQPYPTREKARVDVWIQIDRVHTWGDVPAN